MGNPFLGPFLERLGGGVWAKTGDESEVERGEERRESEDERKSRRAIPTRKNRVEMKVGAVSCCVVLCCEAT